MFIIKFILAWFLISTILVVGITAIGGMIVMVIEVIKEVVRRKGYRR